MPAQTKIPRGKFFIEDRTNAKGEATIYIRYFLQRYAKRSTGINIPPTAWDEENNCVKASHPNASRINLALQNFKCDIDNRLMDYEGELNLTVLNFILNGGDPTHKGDLPDESPTQVVNKNTSFVDYCKKVNDLKYGKKEISSGHRSVWLPKDVHRKAKLLALWMEAEGIPRPGSIGELLAEAFDTLIDIKYPKAKKYVEMK